jgi:hypothetical protein
LKSRNPDWPDNINSTYLSNKDRWKENGVQKNLIITNLLRIRILSFQNLTYQGESGQDLTAIIFIFLLLLLSVIIHIL